MGNPKISVIIPVYNTEAYIRKCLDSIIHQTYRNLEIIVVVNGSTDHCGKICIEYATRDERICVVQKEHGTIASARNVGLEVASGDWIGFVDSDDYIESDYYEYLYSIAARTGAEIVQCGAFFEFGHMSKIGYAPGEDICIDTDHITDSSTFFGNTVWCRIFKRKTVIDLKFDSKYIIGEDLLFNLHALSKSNKTAFASCAKYHYVQRADSVCNAPLTEATLVSVRNMLLCAENEFIRYENIQQFCRESRMRNNLDMCSKIVRYGLESSNAKMINTIRHELRDLCERRFAGVSFSSKEKLKSILIATNWRFYEFMRRTFAGYRKGWHRRCQNTNQCGFVKKRIKDAKS